MLDPFDLLIRNVTPFHSGQEDHETTGDKQVEAIQAGHDGQGKELHGEHADVLKDEPGCDRDTDQAEPEEDSPGADAPEHNDSFLDERRDEGQGVVAGDALHHDEFHYVFREITPEHFGTGLGFGSAGPLDPTFPEPQAGIESVEITRA